MISRWPNFWLLLGLMLVGGLFTCSKNDNPLAEGSGTQTGNPSIVGVVVDENGSPQRNIQVRVRPAGYLAQLPEASQKRGAAPVDVTTDSTGYFAFDSLSPGEYLVEINDGTSFSAAVRTLVEEEVKTSLDTLSLKPHAVLSGYLPGYLKTESQYYVQIFGLERLAPVDQGSGFFVFSDLPGGFYDLQIISSNSPDQPTLLENVEALSGENVAVPFYSDWSSRARVRINTTASGAALAETLWGFPMLVNLTANNFNFPEAKPEGEDIRFIKLNNAELPHEIEYWDAATQSAFIWVLVDTLPADSVFSDITLLWGNPDASTRSNGSAVFDTSGGYQAVWHMGGSGGEPMEDASANMFEGEPVGMDGSSDVLGAIGRSQVFDGAGTSISVPGSAYSALNFPAEGPYTLSLWVRADSLAAGWQTLLSKGPESFQIHLHNGVEWNFIENQGPQGADTARAPADLGEWVHLTAVRSGDVHSLYVNGELAQEITSSLAVTPDVETDDVTLGKAAEADSAYFSGALDEVRLSGTSRSPVWIKAGYENQRPGQVLVEVEVLP